jgi:hypothetical protein
MKTTASNLIRWAGLSAMLAGTLYVVMGIFHPPATILSVTTAPWAVVHLLAIAMCFFGLLGLAGLYARQVKESGWLGLAGFLLYSFWLVLITGLTFVEVFVLPLLVTDAPKFVEGFLGMFTGYASEVNLGVLPAVWLLTGPVYILGGTLFGIASIRAGILSRWAAGLFGLGAMLSPAVALLPLDLQPLAAVPVGIGLAWLGYSLWSERRTQAVQALPGKASPKLIQSGAE